MNSVRFSVMMYLKAGEKSILPETARRSTGEMTEKQFHFPTYLKEEIQKVRESYYPVRVNMFTRLTKKKEDPGKLHPNPDDEFCFQEIGPNYSIIAQYEAAFRRFMEFNGDHFYAGTDNGFDTDGIREPLIVQKSRPDGYLILNGHHRWAAALKMAVPKVKIKIVNLTQLKDVRSILAHTRSDRRVTIDLDEVVFTAEGEMEKPLPFPLNRFFTERVRKGIPALLHTLVKKGYDIWVYSAGYYSMDYIRHYFKVWNIRPAGIVTGLGRKIKRDAEADHEIKKLIDTKYNSTVHIDMNLVLRTFSGSKESEEYPLSGSPDSWIREVTEVITALAKKDGKQS